MMTMREIFFSDEGDWGLNEGDFLTTCSSFFFFIIFIWFRCTKELELLNLNDRNIHFQVLISKNVLGYLQRKKAVTIGPDYGKSC